MSQLYNNEKSTKDILKKPIQHIKGIGQSRAMLFNKLGIFTIGDMVTYYPRDYEDRGRFKTIAQMVDGELCSFEGTIASKVTESKPRRGLTIQKVSIRDNTGTIIAVWFNQSYLKNTFKTGEKYIFFGRINKRYNYIEVQNPVYEKADSENKKNTCRIVPIYPSTAKLTQNIIRTAIENALELVSGKIEDCLPQYIRSKYKLSEVNYSIYNIHFPKSEEDFKMARYRLVFEEFLLLQLGLLNIKNSLENSKQGIRFRKVAEMQSFIESLPFKLTDAQMKVFHEIENDMESEKVMNRLVQGDVGSGKTIVAVLAMFKAVKSGYQAALMVPTEILAEQHYKTINALMSKFGISVALLTGSLSRSKKQDMLEQIKDGSIDIVIGTHALIEDNVVFGRLGLVITDEQHRFGVRQRNTLSKKGENPDMLVMTATPIPRTLALILYGDLDISIINELPPGRKPVKTYAVDNSMRERINNFIRKKVLEGQQVYIVCPLIEESDTIDAKSAVKTAEEIAEQFSDLRVGLIHGKMKQEDKEAVMHRFVEGNLDILVSTTVIEVGVNVPNATVMVIENAERFGLAQLHQLRGRVGRGSCQSYCILFNESKTQVSRERMRVMEKTNDGFIISEKDLKIRGPGEFFGTRQHGLPDLKIANLYRDMDILKAAQEAAMEILSKDRYLEKEEHLKLRCKIEEVFLSKMKDVSLN